MPARTPSGIALLLVVGVLAMLALLSTAFLTMTQWERRASTQRSQKTKSYLLARSGIEDAVARISMGQATAYGGEDWDNSKALDNLEIPAEILQPGVLDVDACPVRLALRPSFFAQDPVNLGADGLPAPLLRLLDGRARGFSGSLSAEAHYALKVEDLNGRIHVNGGALDALDRDPDGPASPPEAGSLTGNGTADHQDASPEGPNGFLVRLLDNLEVVVTGTLAPTLGAQVVGNRPLGGYRNPGDLKAVLGPARYAQFRNHLTLHAWVDTSVVKPVPVDLRPHRFLDVDDPHRIGTSAAAIAGMTTVTPVAGSGTPAQPWQQGIETSNNHEGTFTYNVAWERHQLYAWRQLRLGTVAFEPRAPVAINTAPRATLAAVLLNLKGSYLETWDGSAGWDGGFGWYNTSCNNSGSTNMSVDPQSTYPYPDPSTEDTPWIRTRADYGKAYGIPGRPWYGPAMPCLAATPHGSGESLVGSGALGRLKETSPIIRDQALAIAQVIRDRVAQKGPFRTWSEFNAFIDALPVWEDLDGDGFLDGIGAPGIPYTVTMHGGATYQRRGYRREDADSNGVMSRQVFTIATGSWSAGNVAWVDLGAGPLGPGQAAGLTFLQKDVIKAMANPNTDLNDLNPDANRFKEVDKTDIGGYGSQLVSGIPQGDPDAYAHTTEFSLDATGCFGISAVGRVLAPGNRVLSEGLGGAAVQAFGIHRDTTQADFMKAFNAGDPAPHPLSSLFSAPTGSYPMAGGQTLVSYPEPQTLPGGVPAADASYDGQIGLGLTGTFPAPDQTIRGDMFHELAASSSGDGSDPDVNGPFHAPLVAPGSAVPGNVFPDGIYGEKDSALKFDMNGNFTETNVLNFWGDPGTYAFYISAWVKTNWLPEASPRPHALVSLSPFWSELWIPAEPGGGLDFMNPFGTYQSVVPLDHVAMRPFGLYFVPARNNYPQGNFQAYIHDATSARGKGWPTRSLLWGTTHSLFSSDTLNHRGTLTAAAGGWQPLQKPLPVTRKPLGRLEGRRWVHLAMMGATHFDTPARSLCLMGRYASSSNVTSWTPANSGQWNMGFGIKQKAVETAHRLGGVNHLRFGEASAFNNMNYTADATFADVHAGGRLWASLIPPAGVNFLAAYQAYYMGASSPAAIGRYYKEDAATFTSASLPAGAACLRRVTWTEIPCDLWFDRADNTTGGALPDGWMDAHADDQFNAAHAPAPNGMRDVRIDIEVFDDVNHTPGNPADDVKLGSFSDPGGANSLPAAKGRAYYKAVFVNEWDVSTRLNTPLDVTPFLDDVTFTWVPAGGAVLLAWEGDGW